MYKNFLFDLDGTLLPMDLKKFIELYLASFCTRFSPVTEIAPKQLADAIWQGSAAMARNDGSCLNSELFWKALNRACGKDMRFYSELFDDYYRNEFSHARKATRQSAAAKSSVEYIKENGGRLVVATNPIFPKAATYTRIKWAGLDPDDFDYITVYDNSSSCKPNLNYYEEICSLCGFVPEESIMIGNDVDEDMCASRLGIGTFLVTDCLINREDKDISAYCHGSFDEFYERLELGDFMKGKGEA